MKMNIGDEHGDEDEDEHSDANVANSGDAHGNDDDNDGALLPLLLPKQGVTIPMVDACSCRKQLLEEDSDENNRSGTTIFLYNKLSTQVDIEAEAYF